MTESIRTDEQIVHGDPVMVRLGGKEYPIRPLSIRRSREWRLRLEARSKKFGKNMADISGKGGMSSFIRAAMIDAPDVIIETFFDYSPELPRAEIEEAATDKELCDAFLEVARFVYPFAGLVAMIRELAGQISPPASN